jgi:hypothetical protein
VVNQLLLLLLLATPDTIAFKCIAKSFDCRVGEKVLG